jgi:PAS domain-containing protein
MKNQEQNIILDSISEGVFTVNSDWCITSFNRAAELITGISRKMAIGKHCRDILRADICETGCTLAQTMQPGCIDFLAKLGPNLSALCERLYIHSCELLFFGLL